MNPALCGWEKVIEQRVKPDGYHRAALVGQVRVGGVKHARVTDNKVAGAHRYILLSGVIEKARIVGVFYAIDVGRVRLAHVVKDVPPSVGSRQHAKAAIFAAGVLHVVHQEDHRRIIAVRSRVLPHETILVPVQARTVWRFADDDRFPEFAAREPHLVKRLQRGRIADNASQFRVRTGINQGTGRPISCVPIRILRRDYTFHTGARLLKESLIRHILQNTVSFVLQLLEFG